MTNEWGHSRESVSKDLRVWFLRESDMPIGEFIDYFNSDIKTSELSFNFPGQSLEPRRHAIRSS